MTDHRITRQMRKAVQGELTKYGVEPFFYIKSKHHCYSYQINGRKFTSTYTLQPKHGGEEEIKNALRQIKRNHAIANE